MRKKRMSSKRNRQDEQEVVRESKSKLVEVLPESFQVMRQHKKPNCEKSTFSGLKCFSSITRKALRVNDECLHFCDKHKVTSISNVISFMMTHKVLVQTLDFVHESEFPDLYLYFSFDTFRVCQKEFFFILEKQNVENEFELEDLIDIEQDIGSFLVQTFGFEDAFKLQFRFPINESIQDIQEVLIYFKDNIVYLNYSFDEDAIIVEVSQDDENELDLESGKNLNEQELTQSLENLKIY